MNKKDKKNLKKRLLDFKSWLNEPLIAIPGDWKNKIEAMLKELEDSILVEKNDSYDVRGHEIEKFVDWKARIDETMKKIEDLILVKKNENYDVDKHINDLSNLHDFEFKISKLINEVQRRRTGELLFEVRKISESLFDLSKREGPEYEKKKRNRIIFFRRGGLIFKFEIINKKILNFLRYKIDYEIEKRYKLHAENIDKQACALLGIKPKKKY